MAERLNAEFTTVCSCCKKEKELSKYKVCEKCRLYFKNKAQKYIDNGMCVGGCGNRIYKGSKRLCFDCQEKANICGKKMTIIYKTKCIDNYGGKCVICGENNYIFLSLDHINNDGCNHFNGNQKKRLRGGSLYAWAIKNNFPNVLQILCFNCNCFKGFAYKESVKIRALYQRKYKLEALSHYGNKCVWCGITDSKLLTFDHINNDGAAQRKQYKQKTSINLIRKLNYPDTFQILCYNCNCAKQFYGYDGTNNE